VRGIGITLKPNKQLCRLRENKLSGAYQTCFLYNRHPWERRNLYDIRHPSADLHIRSTNRYSCQQARKLTQEYLMICSCSKIYKEGNKKRSTIWAYKESMIEWETGYFIDHTPNAGTLETKESPERLRLITQSTGSKCCVILERVLDLIYTLDFCVLDLIYTLFQ